MTDTGTPDWVIRARKIRRWWPEYTPWVFAEIHAWDRTVALAGARYDAESRRIHAGNADGVSTKETS